MVVAVGDSPAAVEVVVGSLLVVGNFAAGGMAVNRKKNYKSFILLTNYKKKK